ncbi:MAG TPA: nucleotidyltransferase domain-containing protein [Puia sp.]|nr:nucleotidyltransferase domain-containing protein [Puia sp.]
MIHNFTEKYKKIIMPIIEKYAPDAKIILYGSRARGDFGQGSDIDIALDTGHKIDIRIMSNISGDLEESDLPINFDIVDFQAVSEKMQQRIVRDGVIWKE